MRVLVTGGAGFIGSHLCKKLLSQKHEVLCLDNLFTGMKENVRDLMKYKAFRFLQWDVTEPYHADVDYIMNLACPASPRFYQIDPVKTAKTSVLGAMHMLDLARECGAGILQTSTSEIYGDPLVHPQTERYWGNVNPIGIRSCYDEGKRMAETLFFDYHRQYGVPIKIVRIFNTYGPGMNPDDGRVVSNFIMQAIRNEEITVYGDGSQTRSFCYIDDLVDGLIRMMNSPNEVTGPINLGNPGEFTMLELAEIIIKLTNSSSKIKFAPIPEDDPRKRKPDIQKAWEILRWKPTVSLEEGLSQCISYYRKLKNDESAEGGNDAKLTDAWERE